MKNQPIGGGLPMPQGLGNAGGKYGKQTAGMFYPVPNSNANDRYTLEASGYPMSN